MAGPLRITSPTRGSATDMSVRVGAHCVGVRTSSPLASLPRDLVSSRTKEILLDAAALLGTGCLGGSTFDCPATGGSASALRTCPMLDVATAFTRDGTYTKKTQL